MKKTILSIALAAMAISAVKAAPQDGDVFIGFRDITAPNSSSYVLDIGSLNNLWNATPGTPINLNVGFTAANLLTDLSGKFGAGWYTSGNIVWSAMGGFNAASDDTGTLGLLAANDSNFPPLSNVVLLGRPTTLAQLSNVNPNTLGSDVSLIRQNANTPGNVVASNVPNAWLSLAGYNNTGSWDSFQYGTGANLYANNSFGSTAFNTIGGSAETAVAYGLAAGFYADDNTAGVPTSKDLGTLNIASDGSVSFTAVPEPSTYALMGFGALLLIIAYRRKSNA